MPPAFFFSPLRKGFLQMLPVFFFFFMPSQHTPLLLPSINAPLPEAFVQKCLAFPPRFSFRPMPLQARFLTIFSFAPR